MQIGKQIRFYRKQKGFTQEQLSEMVGVSFQTVSSWENDEFLPQLDKVEMLASALDVPLSDLFSKEPFEGHSWQLNDRMFSEENMYSFVKITANAAGMKQTLAARPYAKEKHEGQYRKGKLKIPYINHPLHCACHALALGLKEDELIAAILLHDVCEDCKDENGEPIKPEALPVSDAAREAVRLVTKPEEEYEGWKEDYYSAISKNRLATIIKVIDRCNNISMMSTAFTKKKMADYIDVTEKYILPLLDIMKHDYADSCYDAAFLLKYQMLAILEMLKRLL